MKLVESNYLSKFLLAMGVLYFRMGIKLWSMAACAMFLLVGCDSEIEDEVHPLANDCDVIYGQDTVTIRRNGSTLVTIRTFSTEYTVEMLGKNGKAALLTSIEYDSTASGELIRIIEVENSADRKLLLYGAKDVNPREVKILPPAD